MNTGFEINDIEKILRESRFTDSAHKALLWQRLQKDNALRCELSEEELEAAAGGVMPETDHMHERSQK